MVLGSIMMLLCVALGFRASRDPAGPFDGMMKNVSDLAYDNFGAKADVEKAITQQKSGIDGATRGMAVKPDDEGTGG